MNVLQVAKIIESEETARNYWIEQRNIKGIVCKRCGSSEHHWLKTKEHWSCNHCDFRTTPRSGTIMENSKLPFRYWIYGIYMMLNTKKGISALALQQQLACKRYEPIWFMCQKIRVSMGNHDRKYRLKGNVEMDECFITVMENVEDRPVKNDEEDPPQYSRGRGSERKETVAVMASYGTRIKKNGKTKIFLKYISMQVLLDCSDIEIKETGLKTIDKKSILKTDGHPSYNKLGKALKEHIALVSPPKIASKTLPVVHLAISNLKRKLSGIHHCISRGYLQSYLNEFCYKTSRIRVHGELFNHFMSTCAQSKWNSCG